MAGITARHAFVFASVCVVACSKGPNAEAPTSPAIVEARAPAEPAPLELATLPTTGDGDDHASPLTHENAPKHAKESAANALHHGNAGPSPSPWTPPDWQHVSFPMPSLPQFPAMSFPAIAWPFPAPSTTTSTTPTLPSPTPAPKHVPVVYLYGASWCAYCHEAEAHMKARNIAYIYRDVDQPDAADELDAKLKAAGEDDDGIPVQDIDTQLLVGWDQGAFDATYDAKSK